MMTRKDYVATAEILAGFKDLISDQFVFQDLVDEFCDMFEADNPNFQFQKFREACQYEQNFNNTSATSYCRRCVCLLAFDVARFKTRYARNKKRFAKVNHDPEHD